MARMMMKDIKRGMLLALLKEYDSFGSADDTENPALNVFGVAISQGLDISTRDLRLCIDGLSNDGLVLEDETSEWSSGEYYCYLTSRGIEAAQEIQEGENEAIAEIGDGLDATSLVLSPNIPPQASSALTSTTFGFGADSANFGSGTFASSGGGVLQSTLNADDIPAAGRYVSAKDNQEVVEIIESVSKLIEAINEDRTNDFNDKEGRVEELLTLDFMLRQNQICVPLVEEVLRETVQYLANKFKDVAIGQIALHVLKLAASAFGIHF